MKKHEYIGMLVAVASMTGIACSESGDFEEGTAGADSGIVQSYVDPQGRTWILTQAHVEYVQDTGEEPGDEEPADPLLLPFDEAVEALRPYSLSGDSEYTLAQEDAEEFAKIILGVMANERDEFGDPGYAPGETEADDALALPTNLEVGELKSTNIIGSNNWVDRQSSWSSAPYKRVAIMIENSDTMSGGTCSAFKLINQDTAVTAAHCVHSGSSWKSRKNIKFGGQSWTGKSCYGMTVPGCWDGSGVKCDYAVIQFSGRNSANCGNYAVGWFGYQTYSAGSSDINAFVLGFPSDNLPSGWSYPTLAYHYRTDSWVPTLDYNEFRTYIDTEGGMSGGVYAASYSDGYRAKAIHTTGGSSYNKGRVMRSSLIDWFQANDGY